MPERVLQLSKEISKITHRSIEEILNVTKRTHLLAINAQIESAHAGAAGRGFNVVAEEVKTVSTVVQEISGRMTNELEARIRDLQLLGEDLVKQVRGTRLADLALNMIEIIDRNLYERSCDVRWWATDSALVDCLTTSRRDSADLCSQRLAIILRSYTVYLDLWVADAHGTVVAHGRRDAYRKVAGADVSKAGWYRKAMQTQSGEDFVAMDIETNPLLENKPVATYATAIREGGATNGKPIGALGIFFDWSTQAQSVVSGVRISDQERGHTRAMLLDSKFRIIASEPATNNMGEIFPLRFEGHNSKMGSYADDTGSMIGYALTPGYETYKGLGWYGAIAQKL